MLYEKWSLANAAHLAGQGCRGGDVDRVPCGGRGELELRPGEHQVCNARKPTFSELHCKAKFPEAYAISYWMHSW